MSSLYSRFEKAIERIRLALDFHINASIGCAALSEADGDLEACIKLADERMYQMKRINKEVLKT